MNSQPKLKIAILGTRGIPARYGGFETFAEELSTRLVARGHQVTVYARRRFGQNPDGPDSHSGVKIRYSPTFYQKYLETPVHAGTSFWDARSQGFDVAILCNAANAPFAWILKWAGLPLAINVDGIERKRSKWNALGRLWYRLGERCAVLFGTKVVADAEVIAEYYRSKFKIRPVVIAYGAEGKIEPPGKILAEFGLKPNSYILYVSRLEPENNALGVIQAYAASGVNLPLVVVGDAPYATQYKAELRAQAIPGVIFTGYQFGQAYRELRSNCYCYIQATEVGGTHPALVEAMAFGNCIIANSTPEHVEVLGGAGVYYKFNDWMDLAKIMRELSEAPERVSMFGALAVQRAGEKFTWNKITDAYEVLCLELIASRTAPSYRSDLSEHEGPTPMPRSSRHS